MEHLLPDITGLLFILLLGAFVKIATALSIFKQGLGLQGLGFSLAIVGLAFVLSMLVMHSQVDNLKVNSQDQAQIQKQLVPFFERHADSDLKESFQSLSGKLSKGNNVQTEAKIPALSTAFLVTELREAFQIGFIILLPFVVIDLLVANVLVLLGVSQFSYGVVSLPLKLLLFIGVDGWTLLSEKLLLGYI